MKKTLITIGIIFINILLVAQNTENIVTSVETVILNTDRDLYISGENIHFSAFCLTNTKFREKNLSKIMYVELYDKLGKIIVQQKLKIVNGNSASLINIPVNIESGEYNLIAYTQYMKNYINNETNQVPLIIINPEKYGKIKLFGMRNTDNSNLFENKKLLSLNVTTDKEIYNKRKKVKLNISDNIFPDKIKYFTVTVVKKGTLTDYIPMVFPEMKDVKINDIKYYPEIRDLTLTGTFIDTETSKGIPNQKMYLSVLNDSNRQVTINQTDKKGNFIFTLHSLYDKNNIIIKAEKNIPTSQILINNSFLNDFNIFKPLKWNIDSSKIKIIKELYNNYQINEIFKTNTVTENQKYFHSFDFFDKEEIIIDTKDFIDLPTLEEVFDEIVPLVNIGKRNKHSFFTVYDDINKTTYNDPLILYDNVPVFNLNKLLGINPKYIKQIKVINRRYIIGNYIFNGIIFITSKTGKFPGINVSENYKIINYQTCSKTIKTQYPYYQSTDKNNKHIPDFRSTLYWNPDLKVFDSKTIEFYTSDYCSEYEVIIRGISCSGETYVGFSEFKVQ